MALSDEQKRDFREVGFFHLGRVFDGGELAEIRSEYDRILARGVRIGEDGKTPFEFSPLLQLQSPVLCRFATSPKLVEPTVELLGPDVRLYWDQAVCKPPGATSEVPWHQDNGYTPVEPEEYVTCTVAIDATTEENGCLWIQPGSHRAGAKPHRATDAFFHRGYEGPETGVPVEQPEGDVLVFSSLTMHRTGPNRTDRPRRSWVIQFCPAHARHGATKIPFDDRLLVARAGRPLASPHRGRDFDLAALVRDAARLRS
jgi:ectoine hydroxylase-related dioxygenase (phytanoyl-CoA dioxygenase family)